MLVKTRELGEMVADGREIPVNQGHRSVPDDDVEQVGVSVDHGRHLAAEISRAGTDEGTEMVDCWKRG